MNWKYYVLTGERANETTSDVLIEEANANRDLMREFERKNILRRCYATVQSANGERSKCLHRRESLHSVWYDLVHICEIADARMLRRSNYQEIRNNDALLLHLMFFNPLNELGNFNGFHLENYLDRVVRKNERFSAYLSRLGIIEQIPIWNETISTFILTLWKFKYVLLSRSVLKVLIF